MIMIKEMIPNWNPDSPPQTYRNTYHIKTTVWKPCILTFIYSTCSLTQTKCQKKGQARPPWQRHIPMTLVPRQDNIKAIKEPPASAGNYINMHTTSTCGEIRSSRGTLGFSLIDDCTTALHVRDQALCAGRRNWQESLVTHSLFDDSLRWCAGTVLLFVFFKAAQAVMFSLFLTSGAAGLQGASCWHTVPAFVLVRVQYQSLRGNPFGEDWRHGGRNPVI